MYKHSSLLTIASMLVMVQATPAPDVRGDPNQKGTSRQFVSRIPSTFDYAGIEKQKENKNDQFLRSNVDNEANKRKENSEAPQDMLPFRQDAKGVVSSFQRAAPIELPLEWNNPHDSSCEVAIWTDGLTKVAPIKKPFACGGGFESEKFSFTIPADFPAGKCDNESDNCVIQVYAHSVEPRTYTMGIDFVLTGAAAPAAIRPPARASLSRRQAGPNAGASPANSDVATTVFQDAIHYWDSFDTSHVDSTHSGYRGQQGNLVRDEVLAAIKLQSFVGNGGLVPLGNIDKSETKAMRKLVQQAIKAAEKVAVASNKAAQRALNAATPNGEAKTCFEGELYGVVNNADCKRKFTNTYVTNVGYVNILQEFLPKFQAAGLKPYTPMLKQNPGVTPVDPFGAYQGKGNKPSMSPRGSDEAEAEVQAPPPQGQQVAQFGLSAQLAARAAPLTKAFDGDYKTGPKAQGGAGVAAAFDDIGTKRRNKREAPADPNAPDATVNPDDQEAAASNPVNAETLAEEISPISLKSEKKAARAARRDERREKNEQ
jgi:hypothetical protein